MRLTFLFAALALLAFCGLTGRAQDAGRTAMPTWRVEKYDIEAGLPSGASRTVDIRALLSITNVSGKPATSVTLRISPSAEVTGIKVNDASLDFTKAEEKSSSLSLQRLGIRVPSVAAGANATVAVTYKLVIKDNTALSSLSSNQSQLLPLSYWYPTPNSWYFPRGSDNAPVRVKVAAANGASVVSAGADQAGAFDDRLYTQPFFVTGSWDTLNLSGVTVYLPKGSSADAKKRADELATLFSEAKAYVNSVYGRNLDAPLRIVAVRRGAGFGSGGTVLVDESVFRRQKIDSLTAMNVAEAAARLYLGNLISVSGEGYGIISDGLVRYTAAEFLEKRYGKDVADVERTRQRNAYAAVSKRDAAMTVVSPIDDYYFPVVANKGAMAWRLIAKRFGPAEFASIVAGAAKDGSLTVAELREALSGQKNLLDALFDRVTDTNLMVGLPQTSADGTKVALRNVGGFDITTDVVGTTSTGQRLLVPASIAAANWGEAAFKTTEKLVRVEVDADKLYPQTDYSDDVAPREITDSDQLLAVKRLFDKQDYAAAEVLARSVLGIYPRFDDVRILLGRSLLALGKNIDAEREFRVVLEEKLPTARSLAWANVGLGELAAKSNQNDTAVRFAGTAITVDAEYGASFAARTLRNRLTTAAPADPVIRSFFADFDKAAAANRKADLDGLAVPGEVTRFINGIAGSTEQWQTVVRQVDQVDANTVLVETGLSIKLLNKEPESGIAVYRLTKLGNSWKLSSVDMFEVR